jgi:CRP/FNR family cyclic AMP-dependent transcriptional regulator
MRRTRNTKLQLLGAVPLFSGCTGRELSRIASLVDEIDVTGGRVLTTQGESGREFFVVCEGSARVSVNGRKVASLGPGAFFGEMSLLDLGPRTATVAAETDMRLLVLDSRSFSSLLEQAPTVARKILKTMAERLRAAQPAVTH